ncbi:4-diphosphocytidyl-2-C-methyl-D-erythritol kinase [Breznakia sp. PF5-3]|uniref:4-(cytidine 5'-diphospho)-2-C-methyl-D-erythritol kinase n=1 Tax=unclassified Breznakia TaxID=2623764 RepID=UPI00240621A3|nr:MULTISPECIES: 4-(cytidine 5'-diphospho)-2-C-methyl-D-erythritol kinase [unclassified Breznakia]MDF9825083.1 4-diphosphocytidyl-2-C-methyl-D-erythritol kinase [Breznakia sp. PM6-1]MDF9835940.1 4-diphosphocytidyl-2-C-methyl-D-erythritol kinase [Breznakia sp. PF5-3]MDF9837458.1 4-diphosphocytidyl-2-C-methyl-D-erythritol kinase [Breznakia sp. PFB2-8]MDF9859479.1 4-diphosphocytidyl-2-C-methyl-D-erythritol kinase [Breznakia sp. PH5-24]
MEVKAYAKINLTLDVIRKREDGYHEMDMIMTPISLYDTLDVEVADQDTFSSNVEGLRFDENNTIYRAVSLMREHYQIAEHFCITLDKRIPMQAGLAGGSADGAAMLIAINHLCNLQLSEQELVRIGVKIGADVPFCLLNRLSRVQGIGEKIHPISSQLNKHILLVKPQSGVSTKEAFQNIDFKVCEHPNVSLVEKMLTQNDEQFVKHLGNTLQQPAIKLNKDIADVRKAMQQFPFDCVLMSGSGSCVFALSDDIDLIVEAKRHLKNTYDFVESCSMVKNS